MSFQIDSSEVLQHLHNYGIDSVDDEALKLFIKDLKKLIKYELRKNLKSNRETEDCLPLQKLDASVPIYQSSTAPQTEEPFVRMKKPNIYPGIYHCNCDLTRCCEKTVIPECSTDKPLSAKYRKNIPVRGTMKDPENACNCRFIEERKENSGFNNKLPPKKEESTAQNNRPSSSVSCAYRLEQNSTNTSRSVITKKCVDLRSQARCRTKKLTRDPVELYQYYQSIWKQHTLPGENDHAQLRRSIRERLMRVE